MKFDFSNKKDWKPLFDDAKHQNFFQHGLVQPCFDESMKYTDA